MTHSVIVTIDGVPRTCDMDDSLVIGGGRTEVTEQPDPTYAAGVIQGNIGASVGSSLTIDLEPAPGAGFVRRFTGYITDLDAALVSTGVETRLVAVSDGLGRLGRELIGEEPWPQELDGARIARIIATTDVTPAGISAGTVDIVARGVESDVALTQAAIVAGDAAGLLVDVPDGRVAYQDAEYRRNLTTPVLSLDSCDVEDGSVVSQKLGDLINIARVSFGLNRQQVEATDAASIAKWGRAAAPYNTTLAEALDATAYAGRVVALYAEPRWRSASWQVPVWELPEATRIAIAGLVLSDPIELTGMPAPIGSALVHVEGWSEVLTSTTWDMTLAVSERALTYPAQRWIDVPPGLVWDDVPLGITWDDLYSTPLT